MDDSKSRSYRLEVLDQAAFPRVLSPYAFIDAIPDTSTSSRSFFTRQNSEISYLTCDEHKNQWQVKARKILFKNEDTYPVETYPGYTTKFRSISEPVLVLKTIEGIAFYRFDKSSKKIELLALDTTHHDVYNWNESNHTIKFGQFYSEKNATGVLTRSPTEGVKFYQVSEDDVKANSTTPLWPVDFLNPESVDESFWRDPETGFFLADVRRRGQDDIVLRTNQGLKLFEFKPDYSLSKFLETFIGPNDLSDTLLFADITGQAYRDIVLWSAKGLAVFQYQTKENDYTLLSFSPEFAQKRGWTLEYAKSLKVVDLNGDGRDELLLTGPRGITVLSFDPEYNEWEPVLENALEGSKRYAHVIKVLSSCQSNSHQLLLQDQERVHLVNVIEDNEPGEILEEDEEMDDDEGESNSATGVSIRSNVTIPGHIKTADLSTPYPVRLTEQLDYSPLTEAVNTLNGQLQFTLPMVKLPVMGDLTISLAISYSNQAEATVLGKGWSLTPPLSYITADFKSSIFEEDTDYYLFNEGQMLVLNQTLSTESEKAFQVGNQTDTKISYFVQKECWKVDMLEETLIFGRSDPTSSSAVAWGLKWRNWRGAGSDAKHQEPFAQVWYLSERQVKDYNQVIKYQYESMSATVPGGKSYTESVYLKSISDGGHTSLVLTYAPKTADEYDDLPLIDSEGIIQTPQRQRLYLSGYQAVTRDLAQTVSFVYQTHSHERCLTAIEQVFADEREKVIRFHYETVADKLVLAKSTLPTGLEVQFSYQARTGVLLLHQPLRYESVKDTSITSWSDYSVISSKYANDRILLRVLDADALDVFEKSKEGQLQPLGRNSVEYCSIIPRQNFFFAEVHYNNEVEIFLYSRRDGVWSSTPKTMTFDKTAIIQVGEDFIAVARSNSAELTLLEWQETGDEHWKERVLRPPLASAKFPRSIDVSDRLIVVYDDAILWIGYRDKEKQWNSKLLREIPGWSSAIQNVLEKFVLEKNLQEDLYKPLQKRALQIQNNVIALHTLQLSSSKLASQIQVMLLDSNYQISNEALFVVDQEKLDELSPELNYGPGLRLKFDYKTENGKFTVNLKSGIENGTTVDETRLDAIRKYLTSKENNQLLKITLVNWSQYTVGVSPTGVRCANETIDFTGNEWKKEHVPEVELQGQQSSTRLGKYFILEKPNADTSFKLYRVARGKKQDSPILDLMTSKPEKIVIRYPVYIAYQIADRVINYIEFSDPKTLGPSTKLFGENIYAGSPYNMMITTHQSSALESFNFRPVSSRMSQPLTVIATTLRSGKQQRAVAYEYVSSLNETLGVSFYPKVDIIPAAKKSVSGWCEETRVYNASSQQFIRQKTFFDVHGKVIKRVMPDEKVKKDNVDLFFKEAESFGDNVIVDNTGQRIIADCSPYLLKDEEVGYYGFESYEINQIGKASENSLSVNKWQFNDKNVVKQGFAFTGENYLHLDGTKERNDTYFEGTFQPRQQDTTYLASCWLRPSRLLKIGTPVPFLKALVTTAAGEEVMGIMSYVKFQSGDWFYLEVLMDLSFLKQVYIAELGNSHINQNETMATPLPFPETEVKLSVHLIVGPSTGMSVDLDHIRFSPLEDVFRVKVYHPLHDQCTAAIQKNGLIERTIYKRTDQPIGSLDERGSLTSLSSRSSTGYLFPVPKGAAATHQRPTNVLFKPESGFFETFDGHALKSRWTLHNPVVWKIAYGQLQHHHDDWDKIDADARLFDPSSAALRCEVGLLSANAGLRFNLHVGFLQLTRQGDRSKLSLQLNKTVNEVATVLNQGEWIFMVEKNHLWVWLEGVLLLDQKWASEEETAADKTKPWTSFSLEAKGDVRVKDFFLMNNPRVQVEYSNAWGEKTQIIQLNDTRSVLVTETVYDSLGRPAITTKTTELVRGHHQPLLDYYQDFVTNDNSEGLDSVWSTTHLNGLVDQLNSLDQGVAYSRTIYQPNPLHEKQILGLPGPDFSVTGRFSTKFYNETNLPFLNNRFPSDQGFRYYVKIQPSGRQEIKVFNRNKKQVALYQHVPGYDHQLSTYEYDLNNRLIKVLPPFYHEKVHSFIKTEPWKAGDQHLSQKERDWQRLCTHLSYDESGRLLTKTTPDSGTVEYMYNSKGLRFMVFQGETKQTEKVLYFSYNDKGQLIDTGHLTKPLPKSELLTYTDESEELPNAQSSQQFQYTGKDDASQPILRGRLKKVITFNDQEPFLEALSFNADNLVEIKEIFSMSAGVKKSYVGGQVTEIFYPPVLSGNFFPLTHQYNKVGQLVGLGTLTDPTYYARFTYHPTGQLASEQHLPNDQTTFTRQYKHNSPGFLEQLSDPFLTETLSYTKGGYGQAGSGDGMVMQTAFNATWLQQVDPRSLSLKPEQFNVSTSCVQSLIREGYLDEMRRPLKLVHPKADELPISCSRGDGVYSMAKALGEGFFPEYGHSYAYGNHQELTKAKYFVGDAERAPSPLQPKTFSTKIGGLHLADAETIWRLLCDAEYIIQDNALPDVSASHGNPGRDFFRAQKLREDLRKLEIPHKGVFTPYTHQLKKLLMAKFGYRQVLTFDEFETIFLKWEAVDVNSSEEKVKRTKEIAKLVWSVLGTNYKDYIETKFIDILKDYVDFIPDIVRILSQGFSQNLGENTFDVKSYDIDANGNHRLFYTGYDRIELNYREGTNQIENVKVQVITSGKPAQTFAMLHDSQGNVIQALHKGIKNIEYYPTSQRTRRIELTDGRVLRFYYDAGGERVIKRVLSPERDISKETYYIRDEHGRVLVDYQVTYQKSKERSPDVMITGYVYGPRGLLGFIRNNAYYSVITDHEGSVRLVVKGGQVEAAYDYLPYGQLMRCYGDNVEAQITYRYTGKEWDEETGLYNYHARLYDPTIGRFYQIDPKEQYFSPYKYAGNSPVSLVDPDGEFAFIPIIVLAVVGAYVGGASANDNWNPIQWDYTKPGTYAGIAIGGLVGGLALPGASLSVSTLVGVGIGKGAAITITGGLAIGGAYLSAAAANHQLDITKWNFTSPHTWNSLFVGGAAGAGAIGGLGSVKNVFTGLSGATTKSLFVVGTATSVGGLAYLGGVSGNEGEFAPWKWKWEDPATWNGLINGAVGGAMLPAGLVETTKFLGRNAGTMAKNLRSFQKDIKSILKFRSYKISKLSKQLESVPLHVKENYIQGVSRILESLKASGKVAGALGAAGGMIYLENSALNDSWDTWNMTNWQSYEVIFNGLLSLGGGGGKGSKGGGKKGGNKGKKGKKGKGNAHRRCRRSGQCPQAPDEIFIKPVKDEVNFFLNKLREDTKDASGKSKFLNNNNNFESSKVVAVTTKDQTIIGLTNSERPGAVYFRQRGSDRAKIVTHDTNTIGVKPKPKKGEYSTFTVHDDPKINEALLKPIDDQHKKYDSVASKVRGKGLADGRPEQIMRKYMEDRIVPDLLQEDLKCPPHNKERLERIRSIQNDLNKMEKEFKAESKKAADKDVKKSLRNKFEENKSPKDNEIIGIKEAIRNDINSEIDQLNAKRYPLFGKEEVLRIQEEYKKNAEKLPEVLREKEQDRKEVHLSPETKEELEWMFKRALVDETEMKERLQEVQKRRNQNGQQDDKPPEFKNWIKEIEIKLNGLIEDHRITELTDKGLDGYVKNYVQSANIAQNYQVAVDSLQKAKKNTKEMADKLEKATKLKDSAFETIRKEVKNDIEIEEWESLPNKNEFCMFWGATNCAEQHALTAAYNMIEFIDDAKPITHKDMVSIIAFNTNDLEYVPPCTQCKHSTQYIHDRIDYAYELQTLEKTKKSLWVESDLMEKKLQIVQGKIRKHKGRRREIAYKTKAKLKDSLYETWDELRELIGLQKVISEPALESIYDFKEPKVDVIPYKPPVKSRRKRDISSLKNDTILIPPVVNDLYWELEEQNNTPAKLHGRIFLNDTQYIAAEQSFYRASNLQATSGAPNLENWMTDLVKLVKPLFNAAKYLFPRGTIELPYDPNAKLPEDIIYYSKSSELAEITHSNFHSSGVLDCMPWAELDHEYVEGVTCMKSQDKVTVFPLPQESDAAPLMEDHYSDCRALDWNGRRSVHCKGRKSHMIYTPEIQQRPFDHLNDQLILLQVVLHEAKKVYSWFQSFEVESRISLKVTAITEAQKEAWKDAFDGIERTLKYADQEETSLRWAFHILEDRREDYERLSQQREVSVEEVNSLTESLQVLKEELEVELKMLSNANDDKAFAGKMEDVSELPKTLAIDNRLSFSVVDQKLGRAGQHFARVPHQSSVFELTKPTANGIRR